MKTSGYIIVLLFIAALFGSCQKEESMSETDEAPVVRVFDRYLYQEDLKDIGQGHTEKDSLELVENFIKNWAMRMMLLKEAERNLSDELVDLENQIEDYRTSLIVYAYEKEMLSKRLDTLITNDDIVSYYNEYTNNFELGETIYNFQYVKIEQGNPNIQNIGKMLAANKEGDEQKLNQLCKQHALDYSIVGDKWIDRNTILDNFPVTEVNVISMSQNNRLVRTQESDMVFLMRINETTERGTPAPMAYVYEDIKKIILNKRRVTLLDNTYKNIYERQINTNNYQRF